MSDKPYIPDVPDIHFDEKVTPVEDLDYGDDDNVDPESEEYIADARAVYKSLYGFDSTDLFDEDGNPLPIDDDDEEGS